MSILSEATGTPLPEVRDDGASLDEVKNDFGIQPQVDVQLKKTLIGGYSLKSVEKYVASVKADMQQVRQQLEAQIEGLLAEKRTVSQECSVLRDQIRKTEENYRNVSEQIDSMFSEAQMTEAKQHISVLESRLEQADSELVELSRLRQERDSLEAACAEKIDQIERLEKDLTESVMEHERLTRQNKLLEATLQESRDASTEEIRKLSADRQAQEEACEDLRKQIGSHLSRLRDMDDERARLEELKLQLEQERQLLQEQKDQVASQKEDVDLALRAIDDRTSALELREEAVQTRMLEADRISEELKNHTLQAESDKETIRDLSGRLVAAHAQLTDAQGHIISLETQLEDTRTALDTTVSELAEKRSEEQQKDNMISFLQKRSAQGAARIKTLEKDLEDKALLIGQLKDDAEKNAVSEQERLRSQQIAASLRNALSQIMGFMEQQAEDMDLLLDRMKENQSSMKEILDEQAALKIENAELLEGRDADQRKLAALLTENEQLMKKLQLKPENPAFQSANTAGTLSVVGAPDSVAKDDDPELLKATAGQPSLSGIANAKRVYQKLKAEFSDL